MTEAAENTVESPEATLEDFVAEMSAEGDDEAVTDGTQVSEQPAETEVEPEQTFEVNGEQVPVSELIGGYMKGSDYTQKTQGLAAKLEEVEARDEALRRFYETDTTPEWQPEPPRGGLPSNEPASLPEFATETERILFEKNLEHEKVLMALQNESKQRKQKEVYKSIDDTLFGYKDSHPDLTEPEIIQISSTVRTKGLPYTQDSFEIVRKATMSPSVDDIKAQAIAEYQSEQKALKAKSEQAALEPGSAPALGEEPPDIRNMTNEQRDALMLQDFRDMG